VPTRGPSTVLLYALPLALLLAAVVLGVLHGHRAPARGPERPVALPPVEAPDAAGTACSGLLAGLPAALPAGSGPLPRKIIADPEPPGVMAWSSAGDDTGDPVVLRCGLPKPVELGPAAVLMDVDGVRWLTLSESDRDTFITVGRPVYVALTVPRGLGSGPVQAVSDVVRSALPPG
jgi:hypothetical protein